MTHIHKRTIDGVEHIFYDSDDLFEYKEPFNPEVLSTFEWYEHTKRGVFIIKTPTETVSLRLETMQSIPQFHKAMVTLKEWYPNNIIKQPRDVKARTKLNTMYEFLARNCLIEDKPNDRLQQLIGVQADTIKQQIRGEIMRSKHIHLTSFTMNQEHRSSAYWENKYSALIGLQAGGEWDIVDFYYDDEGTFCELGHPIKRVVIVKERHTGVQMQYGEHCIEDFLIIKENELKTLRSYFQKYKDLLVEYWLLAETFATSDIFYKLQTYQVDLMMYLLKNNLLELSTKRSVHQNVRTGKREDLEDGLSNTDVVTIQHNHSAGILVPRFLWKHLIENNNLLQGVDKYNATKSFYTSLDRDYTHLLKVLTYGPYGYNLVDLETNELFTNYLGQPVSKKEFQEYTVNLQLTDSQRRYKTYVGNDIIDLLQEGLNLTPLLDAISTIKPTQLYVEGEPEAQVTYKEDVGQVNITYKGYEWNYKRPLDHLFTDLQSKRQTVVSKVVQSATALMVKSIFTTDILNQKNDDYVGTYDFLKEVGLLQDFKFYNHALDRLDTSQFSYYPNRQVKEIHTKLNPFFRYWKQQMVTKQAADVESSQAFSNFLRSAKVLDQVDNKDYYLQYIDELELEGVRKDEEERRKAEEALKPKEMNAKLADVVLMGVELTDLRDSTRQFLTTPHEKLEWTKENVAYLKYALTHLQPTTSENRYAYVMFLHTMVETEVLPKALQVKFNFLATKVYNTAVQTKNVTEKQWHYGGPAYLETLKNILHLETRRLKRN